MIDYTELKRLAEKSKDSWVNGKWHTRPTLDIWVDEDDSAYITAASPDVVLGLIKSLEHAQMAAEAEAKEVDERNAVIDRLRTQNQALLTERDCAIQMLADWCVAVDGNGSAWDYWDEHYKDAMYRPNPIRELLDAAISKAQAEGGV